MGKAKLSEEEIRRKVLDLLNQVDLNGAEEST
jgi:hypothetical protein